MKRKIFALLLSAIMLALVVSGCGQNTGTSPAPSATSAAPASGAASAAPASAAAETVNPNANKAINVACPIGVSSFDYATNQTFVNPLSNVYDSLIGYDADANIVPWLAEEWTAAPDGLSYTFKLRQDVKFTNGDDFTAEDAVATIKYVMTGKTQRSNYLKVLDDAVAVDEYTLKLTLKSIDTSFLDKLTKVGMYDAALLEQYGDKFGTSMESVVGTGPYILEGWTPNSETFTFKANPAYWNGPADISTINLQVISDFNASTMALQSGQIDYISAVAPPAISFDSLKATGKINIDTFSNSAEISIVMNMKSGPFADVRLRQAVAYAVDRNSMMQVGNNGLGDIAESPANADFRDNPQIAFPYSYDVEKAKQLVSEAGMTGQEVTILVASADPYPKLATVLQGQLQEIGLNATIQQMDVASVSAAVAEATYQIFLIQYTAATKTTADVFATHYLSTNAGSGNLSYFSNPEVDTLLKQALSDTNDTSRQQALAQALELVNKEVPEIPLYFAKGARAYSNALAATASWAYLNTDSFYFLKWAK